MPKVVFIKHYVIKVSFLLLMERKYFFHALALKTEE